MNTIVDWNSILEFWFPEGTNLDVDAGIHRDWWLWRMRGGADAEIIARFTEITERAIRGEFDHWANDPHGRLALIVVHDQFPRSLWRDSPRAFAQDEKALALALEGHGNGHYEALETPWYRTFYNLPFGHCEGPDHLDRLDRVIALAEDILAKAPAHLRAGYAFAAEQPVEVRKVIAAFGRHPHRNAVLGRTSTPDEEAYLKEGRFPHLRPF
ncbi:DUF924 family protein [Sinorhizobium mexicanum]|uniref:DUF924 domain-containing protein n=1 Tax=Sinorhizobium mexicanum TaxID=375549 RepID=A0A859QHK2_9HYPH|nr:DUF924 family protein [Sinorhizobium mexicanum]MBP1882433.1 uncharacterized protein (DUF924 family) [Sinorhizobium mexicanum]QLL62125.1 DUF924 domain-containing protein [Sinorhizobium mexicanum]